MTRTGLRAPKRVLVVCACATGLAASGLAFLGTMGVIATRPVTFLAPTFLLSFIAVVLFVHTVIKISRQPFPFSSREPAAADELSVEYSLEHPQVAQSLRMLRGRSILLVFFVLDVVLVQQIMLDASESPLWRPSPVWEGVESTVPVLLLLSMVALILVFTQVPRLSGWEVSRRMARPRPKVRARITLLGADWRITTLGRWLAYHASWTDYDVQEVHDAYYLTPRRRIWGPVLAIPKQALPKGYDLVRVARYRAVFENASPGAVVETPPPNA